MANSRLKSLAGISEQNNDKERNRLGRLNEETQNNIEVQQNQVAIEEEMNKVLESDEGLTQEQQRSKESAKAENSFYTYRYNFARYNYNTLETIKSMGEEYVKQVNTGLDGIISNNPAMAMVGVALTARSISRKNKASDIFGEALRKTYSLKELPEKQGFVDRYKRNELHIYLNEQTSHILQNRAEQILAYIRGPQPKAMLSKFQREMDVLIEESKSIMENEKRNLEQSGMKLNGFLQNIVLENK